MTDAEREAIKARVDAATPGPWYWWMGERTSLAKPLDIASDAWGQEQIAASKARYLARAYLMPDAEFIARAREDIPALLADVATIEADNAELRGVLGEMRGLLGRLVEGRPVSGAPCAEGAGWNTGFCLSHAYRLPCPVAEARAVLARVSGQREGASK